MTKPFVSILIDTYNHEKFIEQAIVSALEQDFPEMFTLDMIEGQRNALRDPSSVLLSRSAAAAGWRSGAARVMILRGTSSTRSSDRR